jgi:predicted MFS family arabinose efflux permease
LTSAWAPAWAPFRVRGFRIQWPSDLLTYCAFEMEALILGWYILVETGSVLLLSAFAGMLYFGSLVSPLFGVVGDRIGHRIVLAAMRALYTGLAATLLAVALAGALSPLVVFCISALMGMVRPSDMGVRAALVAHIVPGEHLTAAMGISRTTSDLARAMGALTGAGLFAAFGMVAAYWVVTGLYALGLVLVLAMGEPAGDAAAEPPIGASAPLARPSPWRDLMEGLALVWSTPALLAGILLAVLVNLLAFPLSIQLLPYVARGVYGAGETGLGTLVASFATGALVGSVAVSLGRGRTPARTMILSSLAWFACLLVFAQTRSLWSGAAVLAVAGLAQSLCLVTLAVVLLAIAGAKFRGRIMGVRILAIYALPVGAVGGGALIEAIGFRATATLFALAGVALTLAIAWRWHADLSRVDRPGGG